jgi:hypothetical protein
MCSYALIGTKTLKRRWVRYELLRSYDRGNKMLGIHINGVRDKNQQTFLLGKNIFDCLGFVISKDGRYLCLYQRIHDFSRIALSQVLYLQRCI